MGIRLARSVDWIARGSRLALAASVAAVAIGTASNFGYTVPLEVAIQRGLAQVGTPGVLDARANAALDAEDVSLARGLADLGVELNRPLKPATLERLRFAESPEQTFARNTRGAARGFATGVVDGPASLAGALAADFSVYGDVRDLATEGAKMARGEAYSQLLLGLAAAGLAATAATAPSLGAAVPAKIGVSILKAARRAGTLTAEFAADIVRLLPQGAARIEARTVTRTAARSGDEAADAARVAPSGLEALKSATSELGAVSRNVGAGETVLLMRFVKSADDLPELNRFSARFGTKTRAVAELTGRASLRVFRTTIRLGEMLLEHLGALLLWFGSLVAGAVSNLGARAVRGVALRV